MEKHCKNCIHSTFNERVGEWECNKFLVGVVTPIAMAERCRSYAVTAEPPKKKRTRKKRS